MAGRGGFVLFSRRDGAFFFFFRGGTGRLFFFPRRDGVAFFFFSTGRDGAVFFFFRGAGRDGCFWRWHFFWRGGAKSLHRPAKGGLNRPASRPCKALVIYDEDVNSAEVDLGTERIQIIYILCELPCSYLVHTLRPRGFQICLGVRARLDSRSYTLPLLALIRKRTRNR